MNAQHTSDDDDELIAAINIIPFVDIVLVVLVIFLLTSSVIARAGLNLELPRAANAAQLSGRVISLTLTAHGEILVDGTAVASSSLVDELRGRVVDGARVVVTADKASSYQSVISLIDAAKAAGITSFALNVEWAS